jgi:tetratricopeptide (TPR) repeat protein
MSPRPAPYVGPKPFQESDAHLFHGRHREASELRSLLLSSRLLLVHGPSGAGKTSLFTAGVLPLLRQQEVDILPFGRVGVPAGPAEVSGAGHNVFAQALLACWLPDMPAEERATASVADALRSRVPRIDRFGDPAELVVVLDQAEELFTVWPHRWEQRLDVVRQLATAIDELPALHVLVGLREEFLAPMTTLLTEAGVERYARFHLRPLSPRAAVEAVEGPVAGTGRTFGDGVAGHLVDLIREVEVLDEYLRPTLVVDEYVEPVQLQVTCVRLWQSLPEATSEITRADVERFGDVDAAMADYFTDAVDSVARTTGVPAERIRAWVEETFITEIGTRGTAYEGPSQTRGMRNDIPRGLEDRHVLRAEMRARARWYELAHDRLIEVVRRTNRRILLQEDDRLARQQSAADLLANAETAYSVGEVEEAMRHAQSAVEAYEELGDEWAAANTVAALGDFGLQQSPDKALAHYQQAADMFRALGDERALANVLAAIASQVREAGDAVRAKELLTEVTRIDPESSSGWTELAWTDWYLGHVEEALAEFSTALHQDPTFVAALNGRGQVLADVRRPREALPDLDETIEVADPVTAAYALSARALALFDLGRSEESEADMRDALAATPSNAWAHLRLARIQMEQGRVEDARTSLETALRAEGPRLTEPQRRQALELMGRLRQTSG